jgi:uncharacterized protein (TIGR03435 family)
MGRAILIACAFVLEVIAVPSAFGQGSAIQSEAAPQTANAVAKGPSYEVSSVKPNKSIDCGWRLGPTPDGFDAQCVTLLDLIRDAYGFLMFTGDRILGAPDWAKSDKFDIAAKVDSSDVAELQKLSQDQRGMMLLALLADRFKMVIHTETRELPVFALVIAKNGPKLKEATPDDKGTMRLGRGMLVGQGIPITSLANILMHEPELEGRTVLDKTGLSGKYEFTLQWIPEQGPGQTFPGPEAGAQAAAPPSDDSGPSIYTALQEQLGLKLESTKGPVEFLVIDRVERPSEN